MKGKNRLKFIFLFLSSFFYLNLQSQYTGPDGNNYDSSCMSSEILQGIASVQAWFNDPDGDCVSNDWIVEFALENGTRTTREDDDLRNQVPSTDGSYNFNQHQWDCCNQASTSSGPGGCTYRWVADKYGDLILVCEMN